MSQTNTNNNIEASNTNQNQKARRGRRDQGGSGGKGCGDCQCDYRKGSIAKYLFEGKLKDGCFSKLAIIKSGHQATQYKKIIDALPVLYADMMYKYIDGTIHMRTKLFGTAFLQVYPDPRLYSDTYYVNIETNDPAVVADVNDVCLTTTTMIEKTHIF